jgi:hypothetical protein
MGKSPVHAVTIADNLIPNKDFDVKPLKKS